MNKKLLIVVDVQNDFTTGSLGTKEAQAAIPFIAEYVAKAYREGYDIIYTQDSHDENYLKTLEGKMLPVEHCIMNTWGWRVVDSVGYKKVNGRIRYCCKRQFGYDDWESEYLDQYDEVVMMGFCTDICVISNALVIKTFYPNLPVTVVAKGCAGVTPEKHKAALEVMKSCQINVIEE